MGYSLYVTSCYTGYKITFFTLVGMLLYARVEYN